MGDNIISVEAIVDQTMAVLEQHRNKIEDVFYEYKHDDDLDFSLMVDFGDDANILTEALLTVPYTQASNHISGHVMNGRNVTLTVHNLAIKNALVEKLRENKWCANGG